VIRNGKVPFRSKVQREGQICKQLAIVPDKMREEDSEHIENQPSEADVLSGHLLEGDLVVMASDGLWDNLVPLNPWSLWHNLPRDDGQEQSTDKLLSLINEYLKTSQETKDEELDLTELAHILLKHACKTMNGLLGKPDDVSIVILRVEKFTSQPKPKTSSKNKVNSDTPTEERKLNKKQKKKNKKKLAKAKNDLKSTEQKEIKKRNP